MTPNRHAPRFLAGLLLTALVAVPLAGMPAGAHHDGTSDLTHLCNTGSKWIDREPTPSSSPNSGFLAGWDYGDAPDDTYNGFMTTTYTAPGAVTGRFPSEGATSNAQGWMPTGARHRVTEVAWLGDASLYGSSGPEPLNPLDLPPSREADVTALPDEDLTTTNLAGNTGDHDGGDGSILPATAVLGGSTALDIRVTAAEPINGWFLNVLVDWDFSGTWGGQDPGTGAAEWAVMDVPVSLSAGESRLVTTPSFSVGSTPGTPWLRVTLSPEPIAGNYFIGGYAQGWDGGVVPGAYDFEGLASFSCGETEDHCGILEVTDPGSQPVTCGNTPQLSCVNPSPFAAIRNIRSGTFVVQAASWTWTGQSGMWMSHSAVTANGAFDVYVDHHCTLDFDIRVVKTHSPAGSSPPGTVYGNNVVTGCTTGTHVENVPIGLDYGEYDVIVDWRGCDGSSGQDVVHLAVYDPPVFERDGSPGVSI